MSKEKCHNYYAIHTLIAKPEHKEVGDVMTRTQGNLWGDTVQNNQLIRFIVAGYYRLR